ncbi:hypothetical protein NPIL_166591, partial [Nephila pilipes]
MQVKASTEVFSTRDTINDYDNAFFAAESDIYYGKHESLKSCFSFDLSPEDYILFPNKTVFVPMLDRTYQEQFYILLNDDDLRICYHLEDYEELHDSSSTTSLSLKYFIKGG